VKLVLQDVVLVNKIPTTVLVVTVSELTSQLVNVHQDTMKKKIILVSHVCQLVKLVPMLPNVLVVILNITDT
jgi:hypothetical protein